VLLARHGAKLVLGARRVDRLEALARELGLDEEAVDAVADHVRHAADSRRDDRAAAGERLDRADRGALVRRREHERVEASFAAAEGAFRKLEMPFPLAEVQLEHAEWLTEQGQAGDAATLRAEARATFERLGARPSLDRLDRLDQGAAVEAVPSS